MLTTILFSILAALVSAAVCAVSARFRPRRMKEHSEFRFLTGSRAFMWIFVSVFNVAAAAVLSGSKCLPATTPNVLLAVSMAAFEFTVCVWMDRFALKFFDDYLTYGAFRTARVDYKDIVSARLIRGSRGGPYLIIKTARKAISISVDSLGEAFQLLQGKLSGSR